MMSSYPISTAEWMPNPLSQIDCEYDAERNRRQQRMTATLRDGMAHLREQIAAQEVQIAGLQLMLEAYHALAPWLTIDPRTAGRLVRLAQEEAAWEEYETALPVDMSGYQDEFDEMHTAKPDTETAYEHEWPEPVLPLR